MNEKQTAVYLTVNHLEDCQGTWFLKVGDVLTLKKDKGNIYDDEAIIVYDKNDVKSGYVANSVCSVVRGTCSAGRIYDKISDEAKCIIRFVMIEAGSMICELQMDR